jgi:DNA-binding XRE family transcriptional regulator
MPRPATIAQTISREPREQAVLFVDLSKLRPPAALSTAVADSRPAAGDGGTDHVATVTVALVPRALAAVALRAGADAHLVDLGGLGAGRDEPTAAAPVAAQDLVAVDFEQADPAKDVLGSRFGGGWVRVALDCCSSRSVTSCGRASGSLGPPPGPFLLPYAPYYTVTV